MKKVQPSGAHNRKKKRTRDEIEQLQRGALNAWIKRRNVDVEVKDDVCSGPSNSHDSSDTNPCQPEPNAVSSDTNDTCERDDTDLSLFLKENDFGYLRKHIPDQLKMTIVECGPEKYQHKSGPFRPTCDKDDRSFTKQWFEKRSTNGEVVQRKWLLYSPHKNVCYCFVCFLFSNEQPSSASNFSQEKGFSTWRKLNPRIPDHEKSPSHKAYMREYLNLAVRLRQCTTIDAELQQQISIEKKKWVAITERIVEIISFMAKQNMAFRGHRGEAMCSLAKPEETISENTGNFLAVVKLLAKYDVVLAEHLQRDKDKPKGVTYLSNRIQNEIIDLLCKTIKKRIVSEIKAAKYYTIMVDSTPDISHEDQVSQILRYVRINENKKVEIKEVFLGYFQVNKKDAESLVRKMLEKLAEDSISINDCRGQSYDNASVMAGVKGGVQRKIIEINPKAVFVNCENHSLNLACVHASEVQPVVVTFFGTVEKVFTFFTSSSSRWEVLKTFTKLSVKRHCDTRWSSRYDAVYAIQEEIDNIISSLENLQVGDFSTDTKSDAGLLLNAIQQFNFLSLLNFWCAILEAVQKVSKRLQDPKMGFHQASNDLRGLAEILNLKAEDMINNAIISANEYCDKWEIPIARTRRRNMMAGETTRDVGLTAQQEMGRVMHEIMNRLKMEMNDRSVRLEDLKNRFSFLLNLNSVKIDDEIEKRQLKSDCDEFAKFYDNDVTGASLFDEIVDFVILIGAAGSTVPCDPKDVLQSLMEFGCDVFPTLCIAYRILLTIAFSIASCERSFSKLKLIKTHLRSSMSNERLTNLALISIEKEFLTADVKQEVVKTFSDRRAHLGNRN